MTSPTATSRSGASVSISGTIERLETELARHKELEHLLRATLLRGAGRQRREGKGSYGSGWDHRGGAPRAREITRRARADRESLLLDARRIRLLLHAALDAMHEVPEDEIREDRLRSRWVRRLRRGRKSADGRYLYWLGNGERGHTLKLQVVPGAGRSEIVGRYGDAWKVCAGPPRARPGERRAARLAL